MIQQEAKGKISDDKLEKASDQLTYVETHLSLFIILLSLILTLVFIYCTHLKLDVRQWPRLYAMLLSFCAALSVTMAYTSLINTIVVIRGIYKQKFDEYLYYYPIATQIFREYNKIVLSGLIKFWFVSIPILVLTIVVVETKGVLFLPVIFLIIIGFVFFTLYPFYFTKAKISELKMQTIAFIVKTQDISENQHLDRSMAIVKIAQDSPSQASSNSQMLFWSTILAGCSFALEQILTPILSQIFVS